MAGIFLFQTIRAFACLVNGVFTFKAVQYSLQLPRAAMKVKSLTLNSFQLVVFAFVAHI